MNPGECLCLWMYGFYDYLILIPFKLVWCLFFLFVIFVVGSWYQSLIWNVKKNNSNHYSSSSSSSFPADTPTDYDCSQLMAEPIIATTDRTVRSRTNENHMIAAKSFSSLRARSERVPFVRQSLPWDCGLACVLMVLRANGYQVGLLFFFFFSFFKKKKNI